MNNTKQLEYFKDDDVLWVNIKKGVEYESVEIAPNITVELGKNNDIIGIEILNVSKHFKKSVIARLRKGESNIKNAVSRRKVESS
jgi:uncharacterized protein YuzE